MFQKITPKIKVYLTLKIHISALLKFVSYLPKHHLLPPLPFTILLPLFVSSPTEAAAIHTNYEKRSIYEIGA